MRRFAIFLRHARLAPTGRAKILPPFSLHMLQIGDAAPDFCLPRAGGGRVRLRDYRGQALLLYFFPRAATSGCTRQAQEFAAAFADYRARNCAILGVSADLPAKQARFHAAHNLPFALGCDETNQICSLYGVWQEKPFYGRKILGIVRSSFLMDGDARLLQIWRRVRLPGHAAAVLAALDALAPSTEKSQPWQKSDGNRTAR